MIQLGTWRCTTFRNLTVLILTFKMSVNMHKEKSLHIIFIHLYYGANNLDFQRAGVFLCHDEGRIMKKYSACHTTMCMPTCNKYFGHAEKLLSVQQKCYSYVCTCYSHIRKYGIHTFVQAIHTFVHTRRSDAIHTA